ncbi:MAG: hypothetical protein QOF98_2008, partial [Streptomyces sp.]|nr:hypothetical protein [Streptomyces sp.]
SLGDYLSQAKAVGGLGLGTVGTSALFLTAILALVVYLTVTRRDQIDDLELPRETPVPQEADAL